MKLTEHEIRDVVKYLEEGKPLPDKYRFMLFDDKREVELIWNGKTNEVTNTVLPFQTIEVIDEPRSEEQASLQQGLFDFSGRQISGWTNKLIWGDNKLILSSLKNGPLRQEIEDQGGIKLIYIDPPFSAGLDYSINVKIGANEPVIKKPSLIEEFAYRNTWGKGGNTFLSMIYERAALMRDLLRNDGLLFFRIDWHWGHYTKAVLDEIFGKDNFQAEIVINRVKKNVTQQGRLSLPTSTDSLFLYFKSHDSNLKSISKKLQEQKDGYWRAMDSAGLRAGPQRVVDGKTFYPPSGRHFTFNQKRVDELYAQGKVRINSRGKLEYFVEPKSETILDTNWTDIAGYAFKTGYPTENAEPLLERVIGIGTKPGDIVADFFNGSGTTVAVAESMGRKWIGTDVGKFSIHTARKRMIEVQRQLKKDGKNYRAFEILNLGRYERQHYVGVNTNLRAEEQERQLVKKEKDFVVLITKAYKAEPIQGFRTFQAQRSSRLVSIGPINLPVSRLYVDKVVEEAIEKGITKVDILAFEFEMGLSPAAQDEAKNKGVDIALKYIPREVFDKRAIEKDQVVFHDVSFIEVKPHIKGKTLSIELTDFSVFYSQDSIDNISAELKPGGTKVEVLGGQIWKITKDKETDIVEKEQLTKHWTDWIDYWSVDFNYESRKEMVRVKKEDSDDYEEQWTGDYVFENEWQSFRTKKDRKLELQTVFKEYMAKSSYKVAIKVIDIFGNDTTKVIEVSL